MKKKISSLLVFTLVLTLLVPAFAFAAVPSDVTDSAQKDAVAKLMALGIVNGYPDGTVRPDNSITRAEFIKALVNTAGYGSTANLLAGTNTKFADVKGSHWASGHVAVAASRGWAKGVDSKGTLFAPDSKITYAQAVTFALRILGYNDEGLIGSWPNNYVIKASELGLLDGLKFSASGNATRGDVFVLLANVLEQETVTYDKDKMQFNSTGKLLVADSFKTSFSKGVVTAASLDKDNKISLSGSLKATSDLYIEGGKTLSDLLGRNVDYLEINKKVVYVRDAQSADEVVTAKYNGTSVTGVTYNTAVTFEGLSGSYTFTTDGSNNVTAYLFVNDKPVTAAQFNLTNGKTYTAYLTTVNNVTKIRAIVASSYDLTDKVITDIVKGYKSYTVSYDTYSFKVDDYTKVTLNGKAATVADLAKYDVVRVKYDPTSATNPVLVVDATRNTVTGKVTYVNTTSKKVAVNGTTYDYASGLSFTVGSEYTLYLNADGVVVYTKAATAVSDSVIFKEFKKYAILEDSVVKEVYDLVGIKTDGTAVNLRLKDNSVATSVYNKGDIVTYTLDSGKVASVSSKAAPTSAEVTISKIDKTYNKIQFANDTDAFYVNSATVYINVSGDKFAVTSLDKLTVNNKVKYHASGNQIGEKDIADYVWVTNDGSSAKADFVIGVFGGVEQSLDENGNVVTVVKLFVGSEYVTKTIPSDSLFSGKELGDLVKLSDASPAEGDGKYDTVNATNEVISYNNIVDADDNSFKVDSKTYYITANTKFYLVVKDSSGNFKSVDTTSFATVQSYKGETDSKITVRVAPEEDNNFASAVVVYVQE